jgi:dihydroflavonol-4-reductase
VYSKKGPTSAQPEAEFRLFCLQASDASQLRSTNQNTTIEEGFIMRVLVLGATGFIGGQIARAAHNRGWKTHGLRRRPEAVGAVGDLPLTWHTGDLYDRGSLAAAMRGCEVVFHAASYYPTYERNIPRSVERGVREMRTVLGAARDAGVERVVYTSSPSTIGPLPGGADRLPDERDAYVPGSVRSAYYEAKWSMECEAALATLDGLPVVTLVPTTVFGPGDVKPTTSLLVLMIARRSLPIMVDVVVNVVDGRDVALAHIRAAEGGRPGERYIVGGHNVNLIDLMALAAQIAGVRPPRPVSRGMGIAVMRLINALRLPIKDTARQLEHWGPLNAQKAMDAFDLEPTSLEDMLRDTLEWFQERGYY